MFPALYRITGQRQLIRLACRALLVNARRPRQLQSDARTLARRSASVEASQGTDQGDTAGVELDETATGSQGKFGAGLDDDTITRLDMDFLAGLDELAAAQLEMLTAADQQVIAGLDLDLAQAMDEAVLFGVQLTVAVAMDTLMALVADLATVVVADVFIPVALGMDVDFLLPLAILDAQFVVALAAWATQALEGAPGLVPG